MLVLFSAMLQPGDVNSCIVPYMQMTSFIIVDITFVLHFLTSPNTFASNAKKPSCFFPVPQAADCISKVVQRANVPVIYLSTDAAESETDLLQSLVVVNGKAIPLVKRPVRNSAEKWDALLYRHGLEGDSQVGLWFIFH